MPVSVQDCVMTFQGYLRGEGHFSPHWQLARCFSGYFDFPSGGMKNREETLPSRPGLDRSLWRMWYQQSASLLPGEDDELGTTRQVLPFDSVCGSAGTRHSRALKLMELLLHPKPLRPIPSSSATCFQGQEPLDLS